MTIRLPCQSCGSKLKLPDYAAGRKAQCPACFSVFVVRATVALERGTATRHGEAIVEIDEEASMAPSRLRSGKKTRLRDKVAERSESEAVVEIDEEPQPKALGPAKVTAPVRAEGPRKLKKKKKKYPKSREPIDVPGWVWWTAGVGGAFALCLIAAVVAVATGNTDGLFYYGMRLAIMLPVSMIILVISMVVSSQLAGGIDFGEVHTAIAKALLLLFAVNVISLVPFGIFLCLPVWLLGLMYLFNLDVWETRFLLFINFVLNYVARYAMMAMLASALHHLPSTIDQDDQPTIQIPAMDHNQDREPDDQ